MAKSLGATWLLEKVKLTMLLAISVKLFGAKPTAKPSPTSNPQPGTGVGVGDGITLGETDGLTLGETDGLTLGETDGLTLGVGVGLSSPAGTAFTLPRTRTLEYGNLSSWLSGARITICLAALRCASAKGIVQTETSRR